ncbi:MAG: VanZ family protein [Clostridia bacterium]|nr:VanZ family protein [Clostridia bacterium]
MTAKTRGNIIFVSLIAASVLATAFIFYNSAQPAAVSSETSGGFTEFASQLLENIGFKPDRNVISFIVRKTAHFAEYFILSALVFFSVALRVSGKKIPFASSVGYCAAVAAVDEFVVQRMTEGRSPEFFDVGIDTCGALLSAGIMLLVIHIKNKRKNK